jgi:hypothetical protein
MTGPTMLRQWLRIIATDQMPREGDIVNAPGLSMTNAWRLTDGDCWRHLF